MQPNDVCLRMRWDDDAPTDADMSVALRLRPDGQSGERASRQRRFTSPPLLNMRHSFGTGRRFFQQLGLYRYLLALAVLCGVLGAVAGGLLMPVGGEATAVLVGAALAPELMQAESAVLQGAGIADAIVARVGVAELSRCHVFSVPLGLLTSTCFSGSGQPSAVQARAVVHNALSVSLDESGKFLHLAVLHADSAVATAMLQAALAQEARERGQIAVLPHTSELGAQLDNAKAQVAQLDRQITSLRDGGHVYNAAQELASSQAEEAGLAARETDLQRRLSAIQAELAKAQELLRSTPPQLRETQETARHDTNDTARQALMQLRLERAHLESAYAPGYPGLVEVDRKIRIAEENLRTRPPSLETTALERRNPVHSALSLNVAALAPQVDGVVAELSAVRQQRTRLSARASELRSTAVGVEALLSQRQAQMAVVQEVSANLARVRAQNAMNASTLSALRWIVQSRTETWPGGFRVFGALAGGAGGFFACLGVMRLRGQFRRSYRNAEEAREALDLPALAHVSLGVAEGRGFLLPILVDRLLAGRPTLTGMGGRPLLAIHLIGSHPHDGTAEVARRLAQSIAGMTNKGVLLTELGTPGEEWIESIQPQAAARPQSVAPLADHDADPNRDIIVDSSEISARAGQTAVRMLPSRAIQPVACAQDLVEAMLEATDHDDLPMAMQLLRLRSDHQVMVIVSPAAASGAETASLLHRPDISVLVLHALHSEKAAMARLCSRLARQAVHPSGFIFTDHEHAG